MFQIFVADFGLNTLLIFFIRWQTAKRGRAGKKEWLKYDRFKREDKVLGLIL